MKVYAKLNNKLAVWNVATDSHIDALIAVKQDKELAQLKTATLVVIK